MPTKTDLAPLTKADALAFVKSIKSRMGDVRGMIVELHNRLGWKVLGYDTWDACVKAEFEEEVGGKAVVYRHLRTARLGARMSPIGDKLFPKSGGLTPEHARATEGLATEDDAVTAITAAAKEAKIKGLKLTGKAIKAVAKALCLPTKKSKAVAAEVKAVVTEVFRDAEQPLEGIEPGDAPTDTNGRPIPEGLRPAFEVGPELRAINRELEGIKKRMEAVAEGPAAAWLDIALCRSDIGNVKNAVKFGIPDTVHGACKGRGCAECREAGYLNKTAGRREAKGE